MQTRIDNTINNLSVHSINDSKTYVILNANLYHQTVMKDIFKMVEDVRDFRISVHVWICYPICGWHVLWMRDYPLCSKDKMKRGAQIIYLSLHVGFDTRYLRCISEIDEYDSVTELLTPNSYSMLNY